MYSLLSAIHSIHQGYVFSDLIDRIKSPALPAPNPDIPFCQRDPPHPNIVNMQSDVLPERADIVIIGSGISGASVAYTILSECRDMSIEKTVVVLEARDMCSGATGRNGGQIKCVPWALYSDLKKMMPAEDAKRIVKFQLLHLDIMTQLAKEEGMEHAEARTVKGIDIFTDEDTFRDAHELLAEMRREMTTYANFITIFQAEAARDAFELTDDCKGAFTYDAGVVWSFRLVSDIFQLLLQRNPGRFFLETNVTAQRVTVAEEIQFPYQIETSRGMIKATHVVHATDGFAANLIPGLNGKIFPVRGHMSVQLASLASRSLVPGRAWHIIGKKTFDYMTRRPSNENGGQILLGGGFFHSPDQGKDEVGIWTDRGHNLPTSAYLRGMPAGIFQEPFTGVRHEWTGCTGYTLDLVPYVGRLDESLTERLNTSRGLVVPEFGVTEPDEWITAGFGGEGMVSAWLSGTALGLMILGRHRAYLPRLPGRPAGRVIDWFPEGLRISNKRVKEKDVHDFAYIL